MTSVSPLRRKAPGSFGRAKGLIIGVLTYRKDDEGDWIMLSSEVPLLRAVTPSEPSLYCRMTGKKHAISP